jgi:hypothetical protein
LEQGVKAQELPVEQKLSKKLLASEKVVVYHANYMVKKFRIFGVEVRNRLKVYDMITDIICGLG